ncbi:MAG TPA: class I SAM-dependent methyltransferase [Gemmataceae bacterium]|jgi:SAM-dependent methyltransferase
MIYSPQLRPAAARPGVTWDDPACPLCGGDRRTPVVEAPDPTPGGPGLRFAVVRCDECGLHVTSPRPDPATIRQFYPPSYRPTQRPRERDRSAKFRRLAAAIGRTAPGRLLDFGCGGGALLAWAAGQGWSVTGIDASADAVAAVRGGLGVRAFAGTLPHPALAAESFDVVTMWHSLEHVHEPLTTLREVRRLLVPGGRLVVAVPNIAGAAFGWFGPAWFGLDLPRHLTHFTPPTLRRMLERAGFRVVAVRPDRHADWLRSSVKLAARTDRPPVWQRALAGRAVAKLVTHGCAAVGRADGLLATATTE